MTLVGLNELCTGYSKLMESIPITQVVHGHLHVQGANSVYVLQLDFYTDDECKSYWYVGCTSIAPSQRASQHKTSLRRCRVTTHVGLSALFTPALANVTRIEMNFTVVYGGLSIAQAKVQEKELSTRLKLLFCDSVLTNPKGVSACV